jgi:hypothetical protein
MTQRRQKTLEELQRRNYSHRTPKTYIRIVRDFAAFFYRPPDKLGPEHIRQYQAHLFQSKKLSTASYNSYAQVPQVWSQFMFEGGIQNRLVPAVGKSEDLLVEGHDVQNRLLLPPPANRSSFTSVLSETTFAESFRKICVRGVGADLGDGIHIGGGADVCCRFVGDEQGSRASSDKNQFPKEWFQKARRLNEPNEIVL